MIKCWLNRILGISLSLIMATENVSAAYAPSPTGLETNAAAVAGEELATPTAVGSSADRDSRNAFKTTTISMNALPLPRTAISMDFQEADVRDVMHLMAVKSGVNIIYGADVTGPVTIHLDRVPFDQAFQTVLTLKGLVALPVGPRIIRVVSSSGLSQEQSLATTFTKVFILKYSIATDIKAPLDAIRASAGRKGVSSVDAKNNALIITDTIQGLKEVEDLIPTLDRKPQQVDIEAKVVEVTLDNSTKMGISWAFAKGVPGTDPNLFGQTIAPTGSQGFGVTGAPSISVKGPASGAAGGTGIDLVSTLGTGAQSAFSFLHQERAFLLQAQLTALASKSKVKVLSTPHIVTLNNTEATINVVTQNPYRTTTSNQGVSTESVSFQEAGVKLSVKPTVNADRRITLKVKPEVSDPSSAPPAFAGAPPALNSRNAETTVLLRDGETIAIGGLIKESNSKGTSGIPFLMSIPILGWLFKSRDDRVQRTELIVFITPRIVAE